MITVDINTKIISDRSRIWALHPGRRKTFSEEFLSHQVIFLELPRLELEAGDDLNTPLLLKKIQRSVAWREYLSEKLSAEQNQRVNPKPPTWDITKYGSSLTSKSLSNLHTTVLAIFFASKKGDIVLVPTASGQFGVVRLGEITTSFDPKDTMSVGGKTDYAVQYRKMLWLPAEPKRRNLSEALAKRVQNPRAAIEIDRVTFGREVFSTAYPNFSMKGISKTTLSGPSYTAKDVRDLVQSIDLISWLIAAFEVLKTGDEQEINSLSMNGFIEKFYDENIIDEIKVSFSSPGIFRVISNNPALAIFIAGAVPLLLAISSDTRSMEVCFTNSSSEQVRSPAATEGTAALEGLLRVLTPQRLSHMSKIARTAHEKIGLHSEAKVSFEPEHPRETKIPQK